MHTRRVLVALIAIVMAFGLAVPAGAMTTVDFCRAERGGTYRLQTLGERAVAHVAKRLGGGLVGDPVTGMPGYVFGDDCVPRLAVIAEAWSVAPDGTTLAMARLEDMDGDGLPSGGDVVRTGSYPLDVLGSAFGTFTTSAFVVVDGSITTAADGAIEVRARSGCGVIDCWFFWATLDEGSRGYERYAEYRIPADGIPTDNTSFFDGWDDGCDPESCSGVFAFDVLFVRPTSPGGPTHLVFDARISSADDSFLEVVTRP